VRFTRGDHLQVWRPVGPIGYYHHGIYVNDKRVIQFGGGIRDKTRANVGAVSLAKFECGGTAKVVPHGGRTWWGVPRFEKMSGEKTVRRAERLTATHPEGLYDLLTKLRTYSRPQTA
jgi:Lecithin retinol acyltransferase